MMQEQGYRFDVLVRLAGRRERSAIRQLARSLVSIARSERDAMRFGLQATALDRLRAIQCDRAIERSAAEAVAAASHAARLARSAHEARRLEAAACAEARSVRDRARIERVRVADASRDAEAQRSHRRGWLERRLRDAARHTAARDSEQALDVWRFLRNDDANR